MDSNSSASAAARRRLLPPALALLATASVFAQTSPTVQDISKYDANKDGRLDEAELAVKARDEERAAKTPIEKVPEGAPLDTDKESIVLSPFVVEADNKGYYASSTLSGTRLNSKIEDLGASITVITKQQLQDTAAVDINDVFLYEANTEGTHTYTEFANDGRGYYVDTAGTNPENANRVRGLGAANVARGNYASSSAIPLDTYNIDAVELSRGPNANIFGVGEAAGTVNIITARANTRRDATQVVFRTDQLGLFRSQFDINRVLYRDKLAIRVLGVYEEKQFERKPSYDKQNRGQVVVTYQPFEKTTIRASYESYHNSNSRQNMVTPRDFVTYWKNAGSPTWVPFATNTAGVVTGGYRLNGNIVSVLPNQEATLLPSGLAQGFTSFWNRASQYIDNGMVQLYMVNRSANTPTGTQIPSPGLANSNLRHMQIGATIPVLYTPIGINNKALYDWENINFAGLNAAKTKADTYNVEIEQWFVNTPRTVLAFQGGFFREQSDNWSRNLVGASDGAPSAVMVDINETLLDGTPNPYFLRPYIGGTQPQTFRRPVQNDNYRGTLAFQLDLTNEKNLLKWAGRHNFTGYAEYRDVVRSPNGLRYRDLISSNHPWLGTPGTAGYNRTGNATAGIYPRYYIGDANGQNIDYAPQQLKQPFGPQTLRWYNSSTNTWVNEAVQVDDIYFSQGLERTETKTAGGVWQGFLLKGKIVPTMGYRKDYLRIRQNSPGAILDINTGTYDLSRIGEFNSAPVFNEGLTRTKGVVVKPLDWFSVHYNESDNFKPEGLAQNVLGEMLANPSGTGKDYGFTINLLKGNLVLRANRYKNVQDNSRSGLATVASRIIRLDFDTSGGGINRDLQDSATTWVQQLNPTWTQAQVDAEVFRILGFSLDHVTKLASGIGISDVNTATSKGYEFELNYTTPRKFWTVKATAAQQQAIDSGLSTAAARYMALRMPVWKSIIDPTTNLYWWTGNTNPDTAASSDANIPLNWYTANFLVPYKLGVANQGKPKPQVREWRASFITNYRLAGITQQPILKNMTVGGGVRWEDQASIGFLAGKPDADGVVRELDGSKPVYDKARHYFDLLAYYDFKMWNDKVKGRLQLNVRNVTEGGRLQVIGVNPDGTPHTYRIIDPRTFTLSATFDL